MHILVRFSLLIAISVNSFIRGFLKLNILSSQRILSGCFWAYNLSSSTLIHERLSFIIFSKVLEYLSLVLFFRFHIKSQLTIL
ncbi:TPA: hypothetical protein DEG21_06010 [Patescibacteria group bacterium]|nr:hypothetical protein [Candidatus Gracilibacteria bacterium]